MQLRRIPPTWPDLSALRWQPRRRGG